jgi:hypothetical protein
VRSRCDEQSLANHATVLGTVARDVLRAARSRAGGGVPPRVVARVLLAPADLGQSVAPRFDDDLASPDDVRRRYVEQQRGHGYAVRVGGTVHDGGGCGTLLDRG